MTNGIVIFILWLLSGCAVAQVGLCEDPKTQRIEWPRPLGLFVEMTACRVGEVQFQVTIRLLSNGHLVEIKRIDAEGNAFVPFADLALDIDDDGVADLGVATGKGRSGDGMHYWLLKDRPLRLIDVGEAPMLSRSSSKPYTLWALVPGSGEIQATRLDYAFTAGRLIQVRSIHLSPIPDGVYRASIVKIPENKNVVMGTELVYLMSKQNAQSCMDGGPCD